MITSETANKWIKSKNYMNVFEESYISFTVMLVSCFVLYTCMGYLGCSDFWWCACHLHWGRVEFAGPFPEESVQRCDDGNLPESQKYR